MDGQEGLTGYNWGVSPVVEESEEDPGRLGTRVSLRGEEGFTSEQFGGHLDQLLLLCP